MYMMKQLNDKLTNNKMLLIFIKIINYFNIKNKKI